ncbi:MAG: YegS/Rv2252/BmrU family lipid kinase [Chitinivibrionales bacterium]|nr:YegS/Rv2252/BmrU family lipid kinase [Chitinivibrionales bacterium]
MTQGITAVILATDMVDGHGERSKEPTGMLRIGDGPAIDRVIEAAHRCEAVDRIVVIGPGRVDRALNMRLVYRRLPGAVSHLRAISALTAALPSDDTDHRYCLLYADAGLLDAEKLQSFIDCASRTGKRGAIGVVPRESLEWREPNAPPAVQLPSGEHCVPAAVAWGHGLPAAITVGEILHVLQQRRTAARERTPRWSDIVHAGDVAALRLEDADLAVRLSDGTAGDVLERHVASSPEKSARRCRLLINPRSGEGMRMPVALKPVLGVAQQSGPQFSSPEQLRRAVERSLSNVGIASDTLLTKSAEHATEEARRATQSHELVVVVGGDGSINAVINGLAGSDTVLGVIPQGSANIFAVQMGIPRDIDKACELIARGSPRQIDLGKIDSRYFACMAGIGFDAYVVKTVNSRLRRVLGLGAFALQGLLSLGTYPFHPIRLTVDDEPKPLTCFLAFVGNTKYYGGEVILSPAASLDDGKLDLVMLNYRGFGNIVKYLWGIHRNELWRLAEVSHRQCTRVRVHAHGGHDIDIDGEYYGTVPVDIRVEPKSLRVIS